MLSPCLFHFCAEYIMWNARADSEAGMKIAVRNINSLRYADDTILMAESKEELKSLLMRMKEEWKSLHKTQHSKNEDHGIQSHYFMANRCGNNGNSDKLSKSLQMMTAAMILEMLAPWKKSYDKPRQHIKKQRHPFATKVHVVKASIFPVVMYRCESWTIQKPECRRIDALKLWC